MKQKRLLIVLALALVCGLGAAVLSVRYLGQSSAPTVSAQATNSAQLAVAARDLPLGTVLRAEDVKMISWSGGELPAGFTSSAATVVGRGVITPVAMNEPLLTTKLADKEAGGGLPIVIPEGMRAVSIRVNDVVSVAGFVRPGTRVDVLVTMDPATGEKSSNMTRVVLQNMLVLATGQTVQRDAEDKPQVVSVITLLVTPQQAERVILASNEGSIQLALRNTLDLTETATPGIRAATLMGAGARTAPVAVRTVQVRGTPTMAAPKPSAPRQTGTTTVVETIRGGERTLSTFSSSGGS